MTTTLVDIPVVISLCIEDNVPILRSVYPLRFTPEKIKTFYDKAKEFPVIFSKPIPDQQAFLDAFVYYNRHDEPELNGLFWVVDDFVGIFYITNILEEECDVHYAFFDKKQKGRVDLVKDMVKFIFKEYPFRRLNAEIPAYANHPLYFIKKCGFKEEGRKRSCALWKGSYFDVILYGLLRTEI